MGLAEDALRTPSDQRETFLRAVCQQDKQLYDEVSEIVQWEERMGGFMREPLIDLIEQEGLDRPFQPGELVAGRYEIIREVGDGGMGFVYEANDLKLEHRVALKCPKLGYERLSPEARNALKVRHPNVCLVNDIHVASTELGELEFLTMEFLDGETLFTRLTRGKLQHKEAMLLARQLCAGLEEAHRSGVLHRDLKPANVILSTDKNNEPRAVITDFGLATDEDGTTDLLGGTPSYMAPELKESGKTSKASDVYALGVILYEVVTGQKPFPAANTAKDDAPVPAAPNKLIKPVPPSKLVKNLPGIWDDAILPCLSPRPEKRPSVTQTLAVLNRKPLYLRPWIAIAAMLLITVGALSWRQIFEYLHPPDISLALLPVQSTDDLSLTGNSVLHKVAENLAFEPKHNPKIQIISLETAAKKGVATPDQTADRLHATHALQLELHRDGNGIAVTASMIDQKNHATVREYSGHFADADLADLPGGLTGTVTAALHLKHLGTESVSPEAAAAYQAGRNYLREGRYSFDQAIEQFQKAARQDAHSPLPLAGLAEAYVFKYRVQGDAKAMDEAGVQLQAAEQLDPDSPSVRLASAWLNIMRNKNEQARQDCSRALEVDPGNATAWMICGYIYDVEGSNDKALEYLNKAIALDPNYFRPHQFLGGYYITRGLLDEAKDQYKLEVANAKNDTDGLSDLMAILIRQGKYDEVLAAAAAAPDIKATPAILNNLGAAQAYKGDDAQALQNYQKAAALEPSNYRSWVNIGDSARRLGNNKVAKTAYQKVLALTSSHLAVNADSRETRAYMAYSEARLGRKPDAEQEIGQALQSPDEDQEIILCAILTYEALKDREQSLKLATRLKPQMKINIEDHPDLADLCKDLRFIQVLGKSK
jgi:serine/threonine protein kinase/tetratricopeptide (TPR) repeat protein